MASLSPVLLGAYVRLEPLGPQHVDALAAAAAADPALYRWSRVPQGAADARSYIEEAGAQREAGTAAPFATVRVADDVVIGSTRFWQIEKWDWPQGAPAYGNDVDVCEIGHTWLTSDAIRTAANTEAKLLMLTHAFEVWRALRVCFHTDMRNERSRAALTRIGAQFEGVLRAHRLAVDGAVRDSARFSIVEPQWPAVKARLTSLLS